MTICSDTGTWSGCACDLTGHLAPGHGLLPAVPLESPELWLTGGRRAPPGPPSGFSEMPAEGRSLGGLVRAAEGLGHPGRRWLGGGGRKDTRRGREGQGTAALRLDSSGARAGLVPWGLGQRPWHRPGRGRGVCSGVQGRRVLLPRGGEESSHLAAASGPQTPVALPPDGPS